MPLIFAVVATLWILNIVYAQQTCSLIAAIGTQCHDERLVVWMIPFFTAPIGAFAVLGSVAMILASLYRDLSDDEREIGIKITRICAVAGGAAGCLFGLIESADRTGMWLLWIAAGLGLGILAGSLSGLLVARATTLFENMRWRGLSTFAFIVLGMAAILVWTFR